MNEKHLSMKNTFCKNENINAKNENTYAVNEKHLGFE
jgi:hypothetical protein